MNRYSYRLFLTASLLLTAVCTTSGQAPGGAHQHPPEEAAYTCPMHPEVREKLPGKCPKCGMTLVSAKLPAPATLLPPGTQTPEGPRLRLEDLEKMALANNPTLGQAASDIRAAAGRAKQTGLYPNPVIGASGAEISTGPIIRGGELGGFLEQRVVTAGKLGLSRRVADQDRV